MAHSNACPISSLTGHHFTSLVIIVTRKLASVIFARKMATSTPGIPKSELCQAVPSDFVFEMWGILGIRNTCAVLPPRLHPPDYFRRRRFSHA